MRFVFLSDRQKPRVWEFDGIDDCIGTEFGVEFHIVFETNFQTRHPSKLKSTCGCLACASLNDKGQLKNMNPLITLICRILSGEKLEPSSKQDSSYWLSLLAVAPVSIVGFTLLSHWLESSMGLVLDHVFSLMVFAIVICFVTFGMVFLLARMFIGRPGLLLLLSVASWGLTGFFMLRGA